MPHGAGGIRMDRVNIVEVIAGRVEWLQLLAVALDQNDVTHVASGGNYLFAIICSFIGSWQLSSLPKEFPW
jgi:hypothetical protein